jgi:hypothetical protein
MPCFIYKSLVELSFDNCVGLGGLEHWGPLAALESLVINNCSTITQLPNLQNSPRLSNVIVMNCERFREVLKGAVMKSSRISQVGKNCAWDWRKCYLIEQDILNCLIGWREVESIVIIWICSVDSTFNLFSSQAQP